MAKKALKIDSMTDEEVVDAPTLARLCRLDVRTVLKHAENGIVVRVSRGRFALEPSLGNLIEHYRKRAAGREARDGKVDVVKANAALRDSQRRLNEIKIAKLEGRLISLPEVEDAWAEVALQVRQLFMAFPSRARFDLPHLTGADQKVLDRLAREMLTELAGVDDPNSPPLPASAK